MGVLDEELAICDLLLVFDEELPLGLDFLWGTDGGPAIALELEGIR